MTDLVVVGGGPGGCAAAIEAARAGASVVLIESDDHVGGNAARSTGYLAFTGYAMQDRAGVEDSVDRFVADMEAEIERQRHRYGLLFDPADARRFAEESAEAYRFLVELGFGFNRFISRPAQHTVDRMVDVESTAMFTGLFAAALDDLEVDVRLSTRAERLLTDGSAVVGVVTDRGEIRAGAVVLAAGGYQANPALRARYQPGARSDTPYLGTEHDRGDGHLMGQAVGGDLINMTMIPPLVMVASALVEDSIAVNLDGERFHDEAGPYDDRVARLGEQRQGLAWYVFDQRVMAAKRQLIEEMPDDPIEEPDLEALAGVLGCPPERLVETVAAWNAIVASGTDRDPDHGRVIFPEPRIGIVEPPFHACRMVEGINFPCGGLRVTEHLAVVDVFGGVIPGLFAVGDCAGGLSATIGLGGMRISGAIVQGRRAGRTVASGVAVGSGTPLPGAPARAPSVGGAGLRIPVVDE